MHLQINNSWCACILTLKFAKYVAYLRLTDGWGTKTRMNLTFLWKGWISLRDWDRNFWVRNLSMSTPGVVIKHLAQRPGPTGTTQSLHQHWRLAKRQPQSALEETLKKLELNKKNTFKLLHTVGTLYRLLLFCRWSVKNKLLSTQTLILFSYYRCKWNVSVYQSPGDSKSWERQVVWNLGQDAGFWSIKRFFF
jgi:hypothetical protein